MNLNNLFSQSKLDQYAAYLRDSSLSDASIQRKLSSLASFKKFLIKNNLIEVQNLSPVLNQLSIPNVSPKSGNFLSKIQIFKKIKFPFLNLRSKIDDRRSSFLLRYVAIFSLFVIGLGLGFTLYRQAFTQSTKNFAYTTASNPTIANRQLSFQGRLTDSSGNPIMSSTTILFKLYDTETVGTGTSLYTSATGNSQTVTPDENGIFSVVIGKTHGTEIPDSVFTQNSAVYLEITAGGETMSPRQPIATVAYALNSETLQGLPPSASGLKNTVLVIDELGNINLGETSPTIKSTSGTLGIEAQAVLIKATDGSGGNIEINPDANGIIKLTTEGSGSTLVGGFINATNANLATGNLFNATINNTNRGYNFINFSNYDTSTTQLTSRFSVDAYGNTNVGGTLSTTNLAVGSSSLVSNLNSDLLDGQHSSYFINIGQTGSLPYDNYNNWKLTTNGAGSTNVLTGNTVNFVNGVGISISQIGSAITINNTSVGTTYTAGVGLSLSPANVFSLNLASANTWTALQNFSAGATISNLSIGGTFLSVGSTNLTTNLNADLLDGIHSSGFVGIGQTGNFITTISVGASGLSVSGSGIGRTLTNTGLVDITNSTLTRSGSAGMYTVGLNLGSTNVWTALQNLSAGATISNLSVGGTFLSVGSTNLVTNLNANYLGGISSTGFVGVGQTGNFITNLTAGTDISITGSGIGRTINDTSTLSTVTGRGASTSTLLSLLGGAYFGTAGSTQGIWKANGNVGIGTTNPTEKLNINGNIQIESSVGTIQGTGAYINFKRNSDNWNSARIEQLYKTGAFGGILSFQTNNGSSVNDISEKMRIANDGNVGIGTTNPTHKLDVVGDAYFSTNLSIGGTFLSVGSTNLVTNLNADLLDGKHASSFEVPLTFTNGLTRTSNDVHLGGALTENTRLNIGSTEALYIQYTTGNIGIGTTAPDKLLHIISSSATIPTSLKIQNNIGSAGAQNQIIFSTSTSLSSDVVGAIINSSRTDIGGAGSTDLIFKNSFTTTMVDNMIIKASGNIGFGTTAPTSKMDIVQKAGGGDSILTIRPTDSSNSSAVLKLQTNNTVGSGSSFSNSDLQFYDGSTLGFRFLAAFGNGASARYGGFIAMADRDGNKLPLKFFTTDAGGTARTAIHIEAGQTAGNSPNVGIANGSPTHRLDVNGDGYFSTNLSIGGTFTLSQGASNNYVLTSDASGNARWSVGSGATYTAGTGLSLSPTNVFSLDLTSSNTWTGLQIFNATGAPFAVGSSNVVTNLNADLLDGQHASAFETALTFSNGLTRTSNDVHLGGILTEATRFNIGSTEVMYFATSGDVGIGTTDSESSKLHIYDSAKSARINLQTADVRSYITNNYDYLLLAIGNGEIAARRDNGNVGIGLGNNNPTHKLDVVGDAYFSTNLSIGGTFLSVGSTNLTTNLNADLLDGYHASSFEVPLTFSNGLTRTSNDVHLGGALTENTRLNIGSTEALYIQYATGNIGIGTTNPGTSLEINNTSGLRLRNPGYGYWDIYAIYENSNPDLIFKANGVENVRISATGNMGIGYGGNLSGGKLLVNGNVGIGTTAPTRVLEVNNALPLIRLNRDGVYAWDMGVDNGTYASTSDFIVRNDLRNTIPFVISQLTGNVGIGTTAPNSRLTILSVNTTTPAFTILNVDGTSGLEIRVDDNSDSQNTFIGLNAGKINTINANYNTALGSDSFTSNTDGYENTTVGAYTLYANTTGKFNAVLGTWALSSNTTGGSNSAFGSAALMSNTTGGANSAFGDSVLKSNNGSGNVAIGGGSLAIGTTLNYNIAIGYLSGYNLSVGSSNIFIGNNNGATGSYSNRLYIGNGQSPIIYGDLATGKVGIGTTNPTESLDVIGNIKASKFYDQDNPLYFTDPANASSTNASLSLTTSGSIRFNSDVGGTHIVASSASRIQNYPNGLLLGVSTSTSGNIVGWDNNLFLNVSGNVGIGTTSPLAKLHIISPAATTIQRWGYNDSVGDAIFNLSLNQVVTSGNVRWSFDQRNNNIDYPNTLVFNQGNVGIGTTNPAFKLQTVGTVGTGIINATAGSNLNISLGIGSTRTGIQLRKNGTAHFGISSTGSDLFFGTASNSDNPDTWGTDLMTIKSGGNVGIGTTNPGVKLDVVGAIKASRLGYYGTYNSAEVQGIWSISEGFPISTANDDFGSQYGMGYAYNKNGGSPFGSHQIVFTSSGVVNAAIGLDGKGYFSNSVGIGTTAPAAKLEVGGGGETARFSGGAAPYLTIGNGTGGSTVGSYIQWDDTADKMYISPHGLQAMSINSSGRVDVSSNSGNGGYISSGSFGGTGNAAYFPSGLWSNGSNAWIYGAVSFNGALSGITTINTSSTITGGASINATTSFRAASGAIHDSNQFYCPSGTCYLNYSGSGATYVGNGGNVVLGGTVTGPGGVLQVYGNVNAASYYGRQGIYGADTVSRMNTHWTGGSVQQWVDATLIGVIQMSDERLKKNIVSFNETKGLDAINKLNPVTFNWKVPGEVPDTQLGFIAQEVREVIPDLVINTGMINETTPDGMLRINYEGLIPVAIKGIQEVDAKLVKVENDLTLTSTGELSVNYNVSDEVLTSLGYDGAKNEIESATYSLTNSTGVIVTRISQFSEIASAKIKAGLISATNIVTKNLIAEKISTKELISPKANIDQLTATDIQTTSITTDELISQRSTIKDLRSDTATVSTLYADNIISKEGSFGDLMAQKVSAVRDELKKLIADNEASSSAITGTSIASLTSDWSMNIASDSAKIEGNLSISNNLVIGAKLLVNGDTQLANAFITGTFSAGEISIKDNFIETTNTALYIQPSNTGSIHMMGETLVIAENGEVQINGNLAVSGSLFANLITANEVQTQKLTAVEINSDQVKIATDSAQVIIAESGFAALATSSANLTSNATAGTATLPAGKTEIIINNNKITSNSMVYITPVGSTKNQVPYIKAKVISASESYFTIALDNPLDQDIEINWWIIN